jgi:hypothetical protein
MAQSDINMCLDFKAMKGEVNNSVVKPDMKKMVAELRQSLDGLEVLVYQDSRGGVVHGDPLCSSLSHSLPPRQVRASQALLAHCPSKRALGVWAEVASVYKQLIRTSNLLYYIDTAYAGLAEAHNVFGLKDARDNLHPDAVAYAQEVVGSFAEMYSGEQVGAYIAALLLTHEYEGEEHDSPIADFAFAVQQKTLTSVSSPTVLVENPVRFVVAVVNAAVDHSLAPLAIMEAVLALHPDGAQGVPLARAYAQVIPAALSEFAQGELVEVVKANEVFAERHNLVNLINIHWPVEQVGRQSKMLVPAPLAKLLDFYL